MNPKLLQAALLVAMFGGDPPKKTKPTIRVVANPQFTRNLFGPIEEIAGKELQLMERNDSGDCMCLFKGRMGENLVDVDHRDIQASGAK